jgi:ABC-2 type transport system ATP-binding protein
MSPAISTDQLSKSYGSTVALQPTSLTVPAGAVFALVGHNGAGKTTLIKILMNIIEPTSGSGTVLGMPSPTLTGAAFERIGYVSENQDLPLWMSVRQYLNYTKEFYPTWDVDSLVQHLELPLDRKLKHLSRGMLMKAALASVLAFSPELIVMDEPFSGLDPLVRDELIAALVSRTQATGATILISSHDLGEIEAFATHVGFLHQGKLLFTEEMAALSARFREVTITFAGTAAPSADPSLPAMLGPADITLPAAPPASWLMMERAGNTVRFVHSHADTENLQQQVASAFPAATGIEAQPMTLRSIFLALAKSGRVPAVPVADPVPAAAYASR